MDRISTVLVLLASLSVNMSWGQQLFTNGAITTGTTSSSGIAAPTGTQWSELQNDADNTAVSNTTPGWGTQGSVTSEAADDFVVPAGQTWTINAFRFMGYQPNAAAATSPFSKLTIKVWHGQPGASKARCIFGDSTTNRLAGSNDALTYRIGNSLNPPGSAVPTATNRKVWEVEATVSPGLVLHAGTYWVSWSAEATGNRAYFFVPVTTVGARTQAGANSQLHSTGIYGTFPWSPIIDAGVGTSPTPVDVEMAFKIFGAATVLATRPNQPGPDGLSLQASPVPASDAVQITIARLQGRVQLLLTDFSGRLVWTGQVPAGSTTATVPVTAIANGIYLLEARTATGSARTRIVKQ